MAEPDTRELGGAPGPDPRPPLPPPPVPAAASSPYDRLRHSRGAGPLPGPRPVVASVPADRPVGSVGLWRTGRPGLVRHWDGHAWTGPLLADPAVGAPGYSRRLLALVGSPRVWVAVLGVVAGVVAVVLGTASAPPDRVLLGVGAALACGATLAAAVWSLERRVHVGRAGPVRAVLGWGLAGGALASVVAIGLELAQQHLPGVASSLTARLAMAGPIEETAKLLLAALLWYRRPRWRDPRLGVGVVLVGSAVFGLGEGVSYLVRLRGASTAAAGDAAAGRVVGLSLLQVRSLVELLHPWVTTAAAAVVWLAVWRSGSRLLGRTALVAWLGAVALHDVQDVAIGRVLGRYAPGLVTLALLVLLVVAYQWLRRSVRELVPPEEVGLQPPRWRPAGPRRGQVPPHVSTGAPGVDRG
ncbi:PrsW family glutamic-type intramembrane protease [Rhodococcus aerolatus]